MNTAKSSTEAAPSATENPDDHVLTYEELAAIDFEPMGGPPNLMSLPNNEDWAADTMPTIRLAYLTLFKTKRQIIAICRDDPDLQADFLNAVIAVQDRLKAVCETLSTVEMRLLIAGAAAFPEGTADR